MTLRDLLIQLFDVFSVFVYFMFVHMCGCTAACLGQDTLKKKIFFNRTEGFSWLNKGFKTK